jgi:hypothetical protein
VGYSLIGTKRRQTVAEAKSTHWEDWPLADLQKESYEFGVQGRRFTNKKNLIHRMREAYWETEKKGGGGGAR